MTRRKRPRFTMPPPPPLTVTEANDLAADLILDLTERAGDADAVGACLTRWLEREDVRRLALVGLAALQATYAHRLTRVPLDTFQPDDLILATTPERTATYV